MKLEISNNYIHQNQPLYVQYQKALDINEKLILEYLKSIEIPVYMNSIPALKALLTVIENIKKTI